jgi:hypothetical protein
MSDEAMTCIVLIVDCESRVEEKREKNEEQFERGTRENKNKCFIYRALKWKRQRTSPVKSDEQERTTRCFFLMYPLWKDDEMFSLVLYSVLDWIDSHLSMKHHRYLFH